MNRVIKFRAWDINKKVFIPNDVYAVITSDFNAFGVMLKDWDNYKQGEYFYDNAQVLSQFTGLHDKNGKEVYEGDVVDVYPFHKHSQKKRYQEVLFRNGSFEASENSFGWEGEGCVELTQCEIIGNIYEHPELIP